MSVKVVCQLSLGGFIILFFYFFRENLAASRLDCASTVSGSAGYVALHFALPVLGHCICSFLRAIHHFSGLSLSHPDCFLEGWCCEEPEHFDIAPLACQAPPQRLHPAAADPGCQCQCQPQWGGQDNLLLPLAAKQRCGLFVFACWEAKPVPERGFEIHPWQTCFDYNCLNALLTWRLFCSSQNGFKNPVPRAFLCAGV